MTANLCPSSNSIYRDDTHITRHCSPELEWKRLVSEERYRETREKQKVRLRKQKQMLLL